MAKEKTKAKAKKRRGIVALIVAAAIAAVYVGVYFSGAVFYPEFTRLSRLEDSYPDALEGFVPQGMTATEDGGVRMICGYMKSEKPSRIYVFRPDGAARIDLKLEDGGDYFGHAGGMTAAGEYVYISNAHKLFVLRLDDVLGAKDGSVLAFIGHVDVPVNAAYSASDAEAVYVGEYHAPGYDTDESHRAASADGEYRAYTVAYALDPEAPLGLAQPFEPAATYATRDAVQGFASLGGGRFAVSCSRGYSDSHLYIYDVSGRTGAGEPVVLDSTNQIKDLKMPRMSEDLEVRGGRLYMGFESGARKFGAGLLPFTLKKTVSFDPAEL